MTNETINQTLTGGFIESIKGINLKSIALSRSTLQKYDCVVITTNHSGVDYDFLRKNTKLIFDTRNVYKKDYSNVVRL